MADSKVWYESILKNGLRRSFGANEITESNPLDWERLRILKDGKLVPAMSKGHVGAPSVLDLDLLQDAAQKGNLFLYRMGEVYPQRLVGDVWYSTDPAIKEEPRPEPKLPEAPKMPPPFSRTLADELKEIGLPPDAQRDQLEPVDQYRYDAAESNLSIRQREYDKMMEPYQAAMRSYESERDRLMQEHNSKLQAWQKRVDAYDSLSVEIKSALRAEESPRRTEILRNQETQRAAALDRSGALEWYNNQFLNRMVFPSSDEALQATDGVDWSRIRVWDGEKFDRIVPEGFTGTPGTEALEKLRSAEQSGSLFQYQAANKYPSKWVGQSWVSMDKTWIDRLKPTPEEPTKPVHPGPEPKLETFMMDISNRKLATNRFFGIFRIPAYRDERAAYETRLKDYQDALDNHRKAVEDYDRQMEKYNEDLAASRQVYDQKLRTYEGMLEQYNLLSTAQIAAMEQEVPRREREIQQQREQQKQRADQLTARQRTNQTRLKQTDNRIDTLTARPRQEQFVSGPGALSQNAYQAIAPNGYDLPANSPITARDAAAIHIALAGSTQAAVNHGLTPLSTQRYGQIMDGILYGDPSAEELQYLGASYGAAKDYIGAYAAGNPQPLADAMSEGLRNLLNVSRNQLTMSPETAALANVAKRIFSVLDKDPALLNSCTLRPEEMDFARGLVDLGDSYQRFLNSSIKLTQSSTGARTLSGDELVANAVDLTLGKLVGNYLENGSQQKEQMLQTLGKTTNGGLNTVRTVYINTPEVRDLTKDPQLQQGTDLELKAKNLATGLHNTLGDNPKDNPQIQDQVRTEVKKQIDLNDPMVIAQKEAQRKVRLHNLETARDLLAIYIPIVKEEVLEESGRIANMHSDLLMTQRIMALDGK